MEFNQDIIRLSAGDVDLAGELIRQWSIDDGDSEASIPEGDYLRQRLAQNDFHVLVARVDGRVVGGLTAYELPMFDKPEREMFLYEIGVIQLFRNRGIARALIDKLKMICMERNIRVIFVGTSMENSVARYLYESTGGVQEIIPWFTFDL
jgi:aminoglycoside 3-N-acetyltransferase I